MAIVQNIDLNLIPDSEAVVVKVNQYDDGTGRIQAHLYLNDTAYTPASGATVRIEGTKPDKHGFSYTASISGNTVTANLTTQMTAVAGRTRAQIIVEEPSGKTGTFVFWLDVQESALASDTDISDTEIPAVVDAARQNAVIASEAAESASDSAAAASASAQGVEGFAEDAEAYAVGKRGGTDVPSTDPTYHNNSKYYAGQAGTAAQSAQASAEAAAVWSEHPPYIGANGNWFVYDPATHAFVDSGIDASITVQMADVTMLEPTATPYVTNTGSNTDPIFHLFLPRGQTGAPGQDGEDGVGIASIVKTGSQTVGGRVVDTYTITYTDNTTTTYQVVNGKDGADGQGSGDMRKEIYDPLNNQYPLNIMTGATASSAGTVGFPPAPGIGDQGKFFKGDGTWAETGSGDANAEEIAPVEETTTASQAYAVNDFLIYDGKLYRVTSSIASGGTITPGTNCTETSVSEAFVRKTGDTMTGAFTVGSRFAATAVGSSSLGNGNQVIASGSCAHAEGNRSVASASYSHAEGLETSAGYSYQHVIGQYNNNKSTDAFEIGNGANSSNRSNALEVTWDGDVKASGDITDGDGNVLSSVAQSTPNYSAKMVSATVDDDTVEFTDTTITATCIIDGPYIEDVLIGIDSVTQSGTTVTYTLEDSSADGASAYIWVRTLNV